MNKHNLQIESTTILLFLLLDKTFFLSWLWYWTIQTYVPNTDFLMANAWGGNKKIVSEGSVISNKDIHVNMFVCVYNNVFFCCWTYLNILSTVGSSFLSLSPFYFLSTSIYLSLFKSLYLTIDLYIFLLIYLNIYLSSIFLPIYMSVYLTNLSIYRSIYLSMHQLTVWWGTWDGWALRCRCWGWRSRRGTARSSPVGCPGGG